MAITYKKIASVTVGAGGTNIISFSSIPATYTDLLVKLSARADSSSGWPSLGIKPNGSSSNLTYRLLQGDGATASSSSGSTGFIGAPPDTSQTASTFASFDIYIPNYAGSTNKSYSVDTVGENNATTSYCYLVAGLWSITSAINQLDFQFLTTTRNFLQYSTATLYGILKA